MLTLIMKDLTIMKKNLVIITIPVLIFMTFLSYKNPYYNSLSYIFIIFFMTYFLFSNMIRYKNIHEDIIINSLPINRKTIIIARYLMLVIYNSIFSSIVIVESIILKAFNISGGGPASIWVFIVSLSMNLIYFSILIPFFVKSDKPVNRVNMIMYVVIFMFPDIIKRFLKTHLGDNVLRFLLNIKNINVIHSMFFILAILLYFVSFNISLKIYKNKEFS